jgi:hypothetical protein
MFRAKVVDRREPHALYPTLYIQQTHSCGFRNNKQTQPQVLKLHVRVCNHVDLKTETDASARARVAVKRWLRREVEQASLVYISGSLTVLTEKWLTTTFNLLYLFVVYLTTPLAVQCTQSQVVKLPNVELEECGRKRTLSSLSYYSGICLESLRITTKTSVVMALCGTKF